jgi:predicted translin family RNA/ssDNA-binding protein
MMDAFPYLMLGCGSKILDVTKTGKDIKKVFDQFDSFVDASVSANQINQNFVENTAIDLLLDHKNEFNDDEVKDELILMLLGVCGCLETIKSCQ